MFKVDRPFPKRTGPFLVVKVHLKILTVEEGGLLNSVSIDGLSIAQLQVEREQPLPQLNSEKFENDEEIPPDKDENDNKSQIAADETDDINSVTKDKISDKILA